MKLKQIGSLFLEAADRFSADMAPRLGAALAFYATISLAPVVLLITAVAGQVFGEEAVRGEIVDQIADVVGLEAAVLIENAIRSAALEADAWVMTLVGAFGLLLAASTLFVNLKMALNTIWGIEPTREGGFVVAIKAFVLRRVIVFGVILGLGFVLIVTVLASTAIEAVGVLFDEVLPVPSIALRGLNALISLGVLTVLFAYIYRTLPDVRIQWNEVWLGALVTAILFTIGKELIAFYMAHSAVGSAYGAAGALIVLLVWIYYSAQIFFFGAELTQVYVMRYGSGWRARRGFHITEEGLVATEGEDASDE
jgi:membrane protein